MDFIADRVKAIDASAIRKIWELSLRMKDPVDFSIGAPDFMAPEAVKQAAIDAIKNDKNGYTLTTGLDELRQKLSQRIGQELAWDNPATIITCGLSGALTLAIMAVVNPGDEVLIPDPFFVSYRHLTNMVNGKPVYIDTYPDFVLSADKIEALITPRSKVLIINSPANPSGTVYDAEQLKAVAEVARKHHLLVISDEIYQEFSYDQPAPSIAQFYENTIVMRGMSKSYGIPGWRLGSITVSKGLEPLLDKMTALQQYTFVCAPQPMQIAAMTAMDTDISQYIADYKVKRDMIYDGLKDKFNLVKPAGAFYAFVPVPKGTASEFVVRAIEKDVLVIPGRAFSERDTHFRISYAASNEKIQQGIERLNKLV